MQKGQESCGFTILGNQKIHATSDVTGQEFLGIYRLWRILGLELAVFGGGRIFCFWSFFLLGHCVVIVVLRVLFGISSQMCSAVQELRSLSC